jgi:feruloyl-CoA synthase
MQTLSQAGAPPAEAAHDMRWRPIDYAPVRVIAERQPDGSIILKAAAELGAFDPSLAQLFRRAVERFPTRVFLAERGADGAWRTLTYEQARAQVDAMAQALIDRGLSAERPVLILSGNSIEHAILMLAGFCAGVPVAPVSVAYSLQSQDHEKLRHIVKVLTPGLVYASDSGAFAKALALCDAEIVVGANSGNMPRARLFSELAGTKPGVGLERAIGAITTDTVAKFLFTSGSTGFPKAVINTHGMLTANQQSLAQVWPFLADEELVLLDWLPWSHTFGGNHNFNMILRHAGTLYIDAGKPVPELVTHTVRNLREVSPTIVFNVPSGYAALLPHLEEDAALARSFFARLRLIFYAGAALPQDLWARLESVSLRTTGERIPMTSSWGSTETAPAATAAHFLLERAGVVGVPIPGVELKLVPSGATHEVRVKGPNVAPGYWRAPQLTAEAFDEEGFYRIGDAMRFADPADPARGLVYDGRTAEDFKLTSGTWVRVGALRVGVLAACSPVLQDAVVAGEDRDHVGLLAWLNIAGCRQLLGEGCPSALQDLARHPHIQAHIRLAMKKWNETHGGRSMRVPRMLLLGEPPLIDANEITDKGYINQRATLHRRAADVQRLFDDAQHPDVVVCDA